MLMVRSFTDLPLTPASLDAIAAAGYSMPTPIQARAIPPILDGSDVIVATPGRLADHLERGTASLGAIRVVVLDEADRMLDMGFAPQVERILRVAPLDRQTLCFSATMPPEVERLVRRHLVRPARIEAGLVARPVAGVTQVLYRADAQRKTPLLLKLLGAERGQTLIFTRPQHRADPVARAVTAAGD